MRNYFIPLTWPVHHVYTIFLHPILYISMTEILACASNPCQNGATCFDNNGGSSYMYVCLCPAGFEGTNCENGT